MQVNKKQFILLWILSILGGLAVLPYVHYMGILPLTMPVWKTILLSASQGALLFGLICWISFKVVPKTDLRPFPTMSKAKIIYPAVISGVLVGFAIFIFERAFFYTSLLSDAAAPIWARALGSLYGAVNEEVALRLFLFTLLYFLVSKCIKKHRTALLWVVNIFVALLFGAGHLPAAFRLSSPSTFEIFRILLLNGIGGVVFGWLYWSRGIWAAIIAHFVADLVIHVLL